MFQISAPLFRIVSLRKGFMFRLVMLAPSSYCWGRWLDHFSSAVEENSVYIYIFIFLLLFLSRKPVGFATSLEETWLLYYLAARLALQ